MNRASSFKADGQVSSPPRKDTVRITDLFRYPIKGCRGVRTARLGFDALGPEADRRWMLVHADGQMVSQRSHPRLACVHLKPQGEGWIAAATGHGSIPLAPNPPGCRRHRYEIWGDEGEAEDAGDAAAAWFSNVLDTPVRLVRAPLVQPRRRERAGRQFALGFADGYPLLICHEASLTDLNEALEAEGARPVPMNRFRPNVVVAGGTAGAELEWSDLETPVGRLELATPCERCSVTTVDQRTGKRPRGAQPLALLARRGRGSRGTKAIFGRNAFALPAGAALRVGMELQPCSGDAPGGFVSSPPNSH